MKLIEAAENADKAVNSNPVDENLKATKLSRDKTNY